MSATVLIHPPTHLPRVHSRRVQPRVPIRGDCAHCGKSDLSAQEEVDTIQAAREQAEKMRKQRAAARRGLGFAGRGDAPKRK